MKAFVFPGQGSQYVGMGKELNAQSNLAGLLFRQANEVLGFDITSIMFAGTDEQLKETKVTQPAVFLDSVIAASCLDEDFKKSMMPAIPSVSSRPSLSRVPWLSRTV